MNPPSHHRAVALALTIAAAFALAHTLGSRRPAPDAPVAPTTTAARDAGAGDSRPVPVDPNIAERGTLERIPGIGPALATRILQARDGGVRFHRAADLEAVRGIGPRTASRLAPYWTFGDGGAQR